MKADEVRARYSAVPLTDEERELILHKNFEAFLTSLE